MVRNSIVVLSVFVFMVIASQVNADDYIIGPGDVVKISVYDNEDLLTITRVSDKGFIILPLLGQVRVNDLTVFQASDIIAKLYSAGYLVNPQVSVFVQEFKSKKAVILGPVKQPGVIGLSGPTTLLELISMAGGLAADFGETVTIKRIVAGEDNVILVDIKALVHDGDLKQNVAIQNGDTVYISKANNCYVTGQVKNPDAYICDGNTTILKLITLAGGFTGIASSSGIRIMRMVDGKKTVIKDVEMDTRVQPDDVIVVPESFF